MQFEVDKRSQRLAGAQRGVALDAREPNRSIRRSIRRRFRDESAKSPEHGRLWVVSQSGLVRPLEVTVGATDGTVTEISGSDVKEGMRVVAGEEGDEETDGQQSEATTDEDKTSNPFLPKTAQGQQTAAGPNVICRETLPWNSSGLKTSARRTTWAKSKSRCCEAFRFPFTEARWWR